MGNFITPTILTDSHKMNKGICLKYNVWTNSTITFTDDYLCIQDKDKNNDINQDSILYYDGFKYTLIEINIRKTHYSINSTNNSTNSKNYIYEVNFVHKNSNEFSPLNYLVLVILLKKSNKFEKDCSFWNIICGSNKLPKKIFKNKNKTYWIGTLKNPKKINLIDFAKKINHEKLIKYSYSKKYFKDFKTFDTKFIIMESNMNDDLFI
jgi:hypothetical protein